MISCDVLIFFFFSFSFFSGLNVLDRIKTMFFFFFFREVKRGYIETLGGGKDYCLILSVYFNDNSCERQTRKS